MTVFGSVSARGYLSGNTDGSDVPGYRRTSKTLPVSPWSFSFTANM